jgi:ubiquinone/menaquinone biosynthesis C-methylase UbiE
MPGLRFVFRTTATVAASWFCLALTVAGTAAAQSRPTTTEEMHKLHQDSAAFIKLLEDPARDAYQKPHEVLSALAIREGERIADIGAGSGYFALRFSKHVGTSGRVFAVDISPEMVLHLNRRIRDAGITNVQTILASADDPLLPPASVDRVFVADTWHHIADPARYLSALAKILKPGGEIVVIDFHKKEMPVGPPAEMRLSREQVVSQFEQHGFRLAREHTFLPYQYFLIFAQAPGQP